MIDCARHDTKVIGSLAAIYVAWRWRMGTGCWIDDLSYLDR